MLPELLLLALLQDESFRSTPGHDAWIWPLSGPVYEPRRLFNTYGQYVGKKGKTPDRLHGGIDIKADCGERVRALADGFVVSVKFQEVGSFNNFVVVAPTMTSPWGISYEHLETIGVDHGDRVHRGEVLGRVHDWNGDPEYRHLHLGLVDASELEPCCQIGGCPLIYLDDPLPLLSGSSDVSAPVFETPPVLFFPDVEAVEPVVVDDPDHIQLDEGVVSMAAHVHDYFPGGSGDDASIFRVAPVRVGVTVRRPVFEGPVAIMFGGSADIVSLWTRLELVYANEIEFRGPLKDSAKLHLYRREEYTESTDSNHDLYFDLCNTEDGIGVWNAVEGTYLIEVTAEDASGNVSSETLRVSVSK